VNHAFEIPFDPVFIKSQSKLFFEIGRENFEKALDFLNTKPIQTS